MKITSIEPVYGNNYKKGYVGFLNYDKSIVSRGIAHFTGWNKISNIHVTHTFFVVDEEYCIEADAFANCVKLTLLKTYFDNPECQIFFRCPIELNEEIANNIVEIALNEIGKKYDFKAILTQALSGSFAGRLLDRLLVGKFEEQVSEILNDADRWICSELVAYVLNEQPQYKNKGILKHPHAGISPQEIFEDSTIFIPWNDRSSFSRTST